MASREDLPAFSDLAARERDVLQRSAKGKLMNEIAHDLNITMKTFEIFLHRIQGKLKSGSIAGLTKDAIREGLNSP